MTFDIIELINTIQHSIQQALGLAMSFEKARWICWNISGSLPSTAQEDLRSMSQALYILMLFHSSHPSLWCPEPWLVSHSAAQNASPSS